MALGRLLPLLLLAAAGFGAAGPAARPPCSAADYRPVYGACDAATGRRVGALRKRPGALCRELSSSPAVRFSANCECTLDDYVSEPVCKSAELEGPFQPVWRVAEKASCSSGMQLPMFNSVWCRKPCRPAILDIMHTECLSDSNRFLVFFYKDPKNHVCEPSQQYPAPAPPPIKVPCDLRCGSGSYLSLDLQRCDAADPAACLVACLKCGAGETSFVGDAYAYEDFTDWPWEFDTGCEGGDFGNRCSRWELLEGWDDANWISYAATFWSGDQHRNDSVKSWLSTKVQIQNPDEAYLQFDYIVRSEKTRTPRGWVGDGLWLYVNGQSISIANDSFVGGQMHVFETSPRIPLPSGNVTIKFVYQKDSVGTEFEDAAWIKNIYISGTKLFATTCTPCPAGTFQPDPETNRCDPCPPNTFSEAGSTACTLCNTTTEAKCRDAGRCRDVLSHKSCVDGNEVVSYSQVNPHCDAAPSWKNETRRGCEPCPAGTLSDGGKVRRCVPCPAGTSAAPGATQCQPCPPGTYGRRVLRYDTFEGFDPAITVGLYGEPWATWCEGLCSNPAFRGWHLSLSNNGSGGYVVAFTTGQMHGTNFRSFLAVNVTLRIAGSVAFQYKRTGWFEESKLVFTRQRFRDSAELLVEVSTEMIPKDWSLIHTASFPLAAGRHGLRWEFIATAADIHPEWRLLGLQVIGAEEGVVELCAMCPEGHFCPGTTKLPTPCPPGTVSNPGQEQCAACFNGSVALPSTNICKMCGAGSRPAATTDFCVPDCSIRHISVDAEWQYELMFLNRSLKAAAPINCTPGSTSAGCSLLYDYHLQLCSTGEPKMVNCAGAGPEAEHAFACQSNPLRGQAWVIGTNRTVSISTAGVWAIDFDGGENCSSAGGHHRTHVRMVCDSQLSLTNAVLTQLGEGPKCVHNFEFRGLQACPVCTTVSFIAQQTSCVNGSRLIRYRPSVPCHAIEPFEAVQQICPVCDSVTAEFCDANFRGWRRTVYQSNASCWTPGTDTGTIEVKLGRCARLRADEANWVTAALALLLGLLTAATAWTTVLGCRHRRLQQAYHLLQVGRPPGGARHHERLFSVTSPPEVWLTADPSSRMAGQVSGDL